MPALKQKRRTAKKSRRATVKRKRPATRTAKSKARPKMKMKAKAKPARKVKPKAKKKALRTTPPHPEAQERPARFDENLEAFHLETTEGTDALAEELGEEFIENVTGADDAASEHREETAIEESGGPFVTTAASTELADDIDESNPPDAMREPLPRVSASAK